MWHSIQEVKRDCLSVCAPASFVLLRYIRDISVVLRRFFEEWQLGYHARHAGHTVRIEELCHAIAVFKSCTGESDGKWLSPIILS